MAACICKNTMFTALFAGTVFKGTGTRFALREAVKIQYFAQSAGNFSTCAEGASETTRADSHTTTFNVRFGKLVDQTGYFTARKGFPTFQVKIPATNPIAEELQAQFGAVFKKSGGTLLWRVTDFSVAAAVAKTVNGHIFIERRFRQFSEFCQLLQLTPERPPG